MNDRIDVHHHLLPADYARWLRTQGVTDAGGYLGIPDFDPLMAELDRRGAVVFVHPSELPGPAAPGIPPFAADFLLDTTRAAFTLVSIAYGSTQQLFPRFV